MSLNSSFIMTRFKYRNGASSWRISGWLHGIRIRKNFKTREEAAAEKTVLDIQTAQAATGLRPTTTFLADPQLREAEDAFRRLDGRNHSLLFYLDYALANFREPQQQKSLHEAVEEYIAGKQKENAQSLLSSQQLRAIRNELKALLIGFPSGPVSQLTATNLTTFLERGSPALKTYNNRRSLVSTFCKFAFQKDWILLNPIEKTPHHRIRHRRGSAVTISAEYAKDLMAYLEYYENGTLVPYFALCMFAGIRPSPRDGEMAKLLPEHIRLDTGVILIEPEVSKVRMKRQVTIQPNLVEWLKKYPFKPFKPSYVEYHRSKLTKRFSLSHDVMRHTYISMFVAKYRSMGEAALQAGNSESIIRKHYLDLKTPAEAENYFNIVPGQREEATEKKNDNALSPCKRSAGDLVGVGAERW